jgi:hypothetical protein
MGPVSVFPKKKNELSIWILEYKLYKKKNSKKMTNTQTYIQQGEYVEFHNFKMRLLIKRDYPSVNEDGYEGFLFWVATEIIKYDGDRLAFHNDCFIFIEDGGGMEEFFEQEMQKYVYCEQMQLSMPRWREYSNGITNTYSIASVHHLDQEISDYHLNEIEERDISIVSKMSYNFFKKIDELLDIWNRLDTSATSTRQKKIQRRYRNSMRLK